MRRPQLTVAPIPEELSDAPAEVIYLWGAHMALKHELGNRDQTMEGRVRAVEKAMQSLVTSQGAHATASASGTAEILRRIGHEDENGSSGLTGKVGGLERAIGTEPDSDGKNGSGLRGDLHKLGQRIEPWDRLRNAVKTLWPVLVAMAIGLGALWGPTLVRLFGSH